MRIVSCNPAEILDPSVPPVFSGYAAGDRAGWDEFWAAYDEHLGPLHAGFDEFCRERGAPALAPRSFIHESPDLNLYLYPAEADYDRRRPLGPTWHRIDTCVREEAGEAELPDDIRHGDGSLIYLSLGSLGSADVGLMQRLCDALAETPHRYIVSKGPQADEITLRDRQWGAEYLPQPILMPLCDLVITHGGNNTTTECFHHGLPMVTLPLFWDQYDNAQRIEELGFGRRLATYEWEAAGLSAAIDSILGDHSILDRMQKISARVKADPGRLRAADLIERAARA